MTRTEERTLTRVVSRDGTEIGSFTSGEGPPLVLVHGALGDHTRWSAMLPYLEPHFAVHAMDRRGRGASGDHTDYDFGREVDDVAAVVDAVAEAAGAEVDVLGSSVGGTFALQAASLTSNIRRLVLFEPPGREVMDRLPAHVVGRLDELMAADDREGVLDLAYRVIAGMSEAEVEHLRGLPEWPQRLAAAHTVPRELRTPPERMFDPGQAATVTTPTLVLLGDQTPEAYLRSAEAVVRAVPDARLVLLEGQNHGAEMFAPEIVAEAVLAFLNERTNEHDRIQQVVSTDGTRIAARVRGEGPPIVFLPAGPGDSELSWNRVAPYLGERFTCYLLETRGRGPSGDHPDHSPERQVEDVLALVEAIGEPVGLVGWGSALWARVASGEPGAAFGVAVYEPGAGEVMDAETGKRMGQVFGEVDRLVGEDRLAEAARTFADGAVIYSEEERAAGAPREFWEGAAERLPLFFLEKRQASTSGGPGATSPETLGAIPVPVLLLRGDRTSRWFSDSVRHVAEHLPDATAREIPGAAHFGPLTHPEDVAREMSQFFAGVRGAAASAATARQGPV
jgi:pimeloyl-ACP methyl ester carboxylesterase